MLIKRLTFEQKVERTKSTYTPAQFLTLPSKSLEGKLGFVEVFVPVVFHIQIHLPTTRALPQLQRNLPETQASIHSKKPDGFVVKLEVKNQ